MSLCFALNHMVAPRLRLSEFFQLAASLGITLVEIRNDLDGRPLQDGTPPEAVRAAAHRAGVTVVSINALQRFDDWTTEREREATDLARYAAVSGARGVVLVPTNDGSATADGERQSRLRRALRGFLPILADLDILGLLEPLGFTTSSLRSKREAAEAIEDTGGGARYRLVHDTFHHALAREPDLYPALTALTHVSGVTEPSVSLADMRDAHRGLVDAGDRLDSAGQIKALLRAGYAGPLSFEPFAVDFHTQLNPAGAIRASMEYLTTQL